MGDLSTPELGKLVERLRDSEKFATGMTRDVLTEAATAIEALEQAVDAFADICDELGCERDNEAGLIAADSLKARTSAAERERDELKAEVERHRAGKITDAQGIAWFESAFGVPLGDMPGRMDVEAMRARLRTPEESP